MAVNIIISIYYFKMDKKMLQIIIRQAHVVQKKKIYKIYIDLHKKYQ